MTIRLLIDCLVTLLTYVDDDDDDNDSTHDERDQSRRRNSCKIVRGGVRLRNFIYNFKSGGGSGVATGDDG